MAGMITQASHDSVVDTVVDGTAIMRARLRDSIECKQRMLDSECVRQAAEVASRIVAALRLGNKVIFFGNGGSSMDAGHLAAELIGRFAIDRPALSALSLPTSIAAMTAIANDYGYAEVFARELRGIGSAGDVAIGLTTSGSSANVLRAFRVAREMGIITVALTGETGGQARRVADICIRVPSGSTPRVQEACMHLGHTICEIVEQEMFG